jgi:TrmH family RNA methyltransferase
MPSHQNRTRLFRIVQSRQNARVKELRAGFARAGRNDQGHISIEGEHLIGEALRSGLQLHTVFIRTGSERVLDRLSLREEEVLELPEDIFASAVETESPQGIAALLQPPQFTILDALAGPRPLVVIAAGLQDPGNLGTVVRSAEAFGASGVIALPGTVSIWNAKSLRASSGSAFRLPVVSASESEVLALLRERGVKTLATIVDGGVEIADFDLTQPCALLIGNEGGGLSESLLAKADARLTIPCPGPVESLNAAVAASVLLYEAARQRAGASERGGWL